MIITPSCCYCCTATGANNDRDTSQFMVTRQIVFKVCVCLCVSVSACWSVYSVSLSVSPCVAWTCVCYVCVCVFVSLCM